MSRLARFLLLVILMSLLVCGAITWIETPQYFNFSKPSVDDLLVDLAPIVSSSIRAINIDDDPWHYSRSGVLAHCHTDGTICVKSDSLTFYPFCLWHEAGHAYSFYLYNKGSYFFAEWNKIGIAGSLSDYGRTNIWEDIAVWTEHVYLDVNGLFSYFDHFWLKRWLEDMEPYRKKLQLLRKYDFITEDDYHIFLSRNSVFQE